ncbi:MAG: LptF/LptG family permease [Janthinobacterium lividum]
MMIYRSYIIKNIFMPFLFAIFVITGISWITQVFKLLYLIDRGINIVDFIQLTILIFPLLIFIATPFITILAVIYVYNKFIQEKQIVILKNAGLSNLNIAFPALIFSLCITVIIYYISIQVIPNSYKKLKMDLSLAKDNLASSFIKEKTFNKLSKNIDIYIDSKSPNDSLTGVVIFDRRIEEKPILLIAQEGRFKNYGKNLVLELFDGLRQAYDLNGNLVELYFSSFSIQINSAKPSSYSHLVRQDANEYYIKELLQLEHISQSRLIAEGHQRIIWPVYNFVFTFLALGILLQYPPNRKSKSVNIIKIALIVVSITSIHFTTLNYAMKDITIIYGCYLIIALTILAGIYLYSRRTS